MKGTRSWRWASGAGRGSPPWMGVRVSGSGGVDRGRGVSRRGDQRRDAGWGAMSVPLDGSGWVGRFSWVRPSPGGGCEGRGLVRCCSFLLVRGVMVRVPAFGERELFATLSICWRERRESAALRCLPATPGRVAARGTRLRFRSGKKGMLAMRRRTMLSLAVVVSSACCAGD